MPNIDLITTTVKAVDWLALPTIFSMWLMLKRAGGTQNILSPSFLALPFLFALAYGLAWSYYPPLAEMRLLPLPKGQGAGIIALILLLVAIFFSRAWRAFFKAMDTKQLVFLGPWRVFYGGILLLLGVNGGLPSQFFWSAALGDIFVGLWAISLIARKLNATTGELRAYNIVGLLDLYHVLGLGAFFLSSFYLANPNVSVLNLLPLAMVPLFIWVHLISLYALRVQSQKIEAK